MAFVAYNPETTHYEFTADADLTTDPYVASAHWIGKTAHITTTGAIYICTLTAGGAHQWQQLASAAAVLIPDQRFTVGSAAYNLLNPGVATYTTVATAIAAAFAGVADGMSLGAASSTSRRVVEIEPLAYAENVVASAFVNLRGMGADPADTVIAPAAGNALDWSAGTNDELVIENLTIRGSVLLQPSAKSQITFRRVNFDDTGTSLPSIVAALSGGATFNVIFEDCTGNIESFVASGSGVATVLIRGALTNLKIDSASGFQLGADIVNGLQIDEGASVSGATLGGVIATMGNGTSSSDSVTFLDCVLNTFSSTIPVVTFSAAPGNGSIDVLGTTFVNPFSSLFTSAGQTVNVTASEYTFLSSVVGLGNVPLPAANVGTVDTKRGNRIANMRRYAFTVPAPGAFGNGYYVTNAPNGAGITLDAFADTHLVDVDYATAGGAIDPDTTSLAFRYALFRLSPPSQSEDGREITIKNASAPGVAAGPIALELPAADGAVEWSVSDPALNTVITSTNYTILGPGDYVKLAADRTVSSWKIVG